MVFHYWSTFQPYLTPFWRVMATKRPKINLKSYFLLLPKHLKFENSGTTIQVKINLDPDMYHLNTLPLPRNEDLNQWAGGGTCKKPKKHAIKLTKC